MSADQMQGAADRLAVKLASLDLDDDEQAVLRGLLAAGATSVEAADDEVAGFAIVSYRPQLTGLPSPTANPFESITFEYGGLVVRYQQQQADGSV